MVDVHCHLNFKAFKKDADKVASAAFESGVGKIINVGTKLDSSEKAVELTEKYENMYAIVGVHPHHADKISQESGEDWVEKLKRLAQKDKVVGIGECGMDFYSYKSNGIVDKKLQEDIFIKQIELAHRLKLPLQIHNRHAGKEILDILVNHSSLLSNHNPGMFHCFSGNRDFLKKVLDMGFYVGFDGNITYPGLAPGEDTPLYELVKFAPLERIVTETDSPFLTPQLYRGSRNEPKYVIIVCKFIAETKKISLEKVIAQTVKNAHTVFALL